MDKVKKLLQTLLDMKPSESSKQQAMLTAKMQGLKLLSQLKLSSSEVGKIVGAIDLYDGVIAGEWTCLYQALGCLEALLVN